MLKRFLIYGLIGWIAEVVFTGAGSLLSGSLSLSAHTYLWMFPIYGLALFMEPLHNQIRIMPWPARGVIWAGFIFLIEYLSGWFLQQLIGFCPWDYSMITSYSMNGFIRLDFLPIWVAAGLIFEQIHNYLDSLLGRVWN